MRTILKMRTLMKMMRMNTTDRRADIMKDGNESVYPITVDVKGIMSLFGIGRNTAMKIGKEAGAVVHLGPRKTLYNVERVRQYLEQRME